MSHWLRFKLRLSGVWAEPQRHSRRAGGAEIARSTLGCDWGFCGVSAGFVADHGRRAGGRCAPRNFAPFTMIFGQICDLKYLASDLVRITVYKNKHQYNLSELI